MKKKKLRSSGSQGSMQVRVPNESPQRQDGWLENQVEAVEDAATEEEGEDSADTRDDLQEDGVSTDMLTELAAREQESEAALDELEQEAEEEIDEEIEEEIDDASGDVDFSGRLAAWEAELLNNLEVLETYPDSRLGDFARFANLSDDRYAKQLVDRYVEQGLVIRTWKSGAGRYSLTVAGQNRLLELRGR